MEKKQCDTECNNPLYYSTEYLQQHNEVTHMKPPEHSATEPKTTTTATAAVS